MLKYFWGFGLLLSVSNIIYFYKIMKQRKDAKLVKNEFYYFKGRNKTCASHTEVKPYNIICTLPTCQFSYVLKIIGHLDSAVKSLDIILYLMTLESLAEAIIRAHKRGVKVRFIADEDMSKSSGSRVNMLKQEGVPVHSKLSTFLMHHKFAIVDENLLITGSYNWTMQATNGNWDNLIITTHKRFVSQYRTEFNKLWNYLVNYTKENTKKKTHETTTIDSSKTDNNRCGPVKQYDD
uniref:Mitochondrial cardiolipin hydrolase n=1 Tax=Clastoptera arizonana TaxID=38151 RepID=A0A1B6DNY1_9HEMI